MSTAVLVQRQAFAGDEKHLVHFLAPHEQRLIKALVPMVPKWMSTVHLTLMTIGWSIGIVIAGYLANTDIRWLWLANACILLQYVSDMLDGAVGRVRNSGLIKWGFYMDHFLDYVFLCAIVIGYAFLLPQAHMPLALLGLAFSAGFMVHTFMDFAITNNFKISCGRFGVSEVRLVLVFSNIVLMAVGKGLLIKVFPFYAAASGLALCWLVYTAQKVYRHLDALQQAKEGGSYEKKIS